MNNLAVITARGGSKRIPRKNIKNFCGKPIIAYSIEAALKSSAFDEVMVSTDDEEIKNVALKFGAKVPFLRSAEMSGDYVMTNAVMTEVVEEYKKIGKEFENICCIYPTAPFLVPERLKEAMNILLNEKVDTVMPVVKFSFPPQRCLVVRDGKVNFMHPENAQVRSQDLEPLYHDVGQFYCMNTKRFMEEGVLIMPNTAPIIMNEMEAQDNDNFYDWEIAEMKYKILHEG